MFEVGDEVYSGRFGEGIVTDVDNNDLYIYPIHVQWKNSCKRSIFTPEGRYNISFNDPDVDIIHMFKLQDRVFYPYYGKGTVVGDFKTDVSSPIRVFWDKPYFADEPYSHFSRDGRMSLHMIDDDENFKLKLLEDVPKEETGGSEMGQIASVSDHNIAKKQDSKAMVEDKKFTETRRRNEEEHKGFKVGDMVYSQFSGVGEIIKIGKNENLEYPIEVKWCYKKDIDTLDYDFFTLDGCFFSDRHNTLRDIVPVEDVDFEVEEEDEGTVERMEDALNKKVEAAVNPAHYKVKGLPEAIDIINHLMHREQYEGFLWGNIMKYAYRYGRKGDKAETAGKIAWYANQLKDLAEEGDNK